MKISNAASDSQKIGNRPPPQRKKDNDLRICTWNVRTLNTPGATRQLEKIVDCYKADIIALQEMRWIGSGMASRQNTDIYYSGYSSHHYGCGFIVGKKLRQRIMDFKPVNERVATIRIKAQF